MPSKLKVDPPLVKKLLDSQKGVVAPILILVLLLAGLGVGYYLVQKPTNLFPKASNNKGFCQEVKLVSQVEGVEQCEKGKFKKINFLCSDKQDYQTLEGDCKSSNEWKKSAQEYCKAKTVCSSPEAPEGTSSDPKVNGLISYWKLDEATGSAQTTDSLGGNNGVITETTVIVGQKIGNSRKFSANRNGSSKIDLPAPILKSNSTQYSISSWIYPSTNGIVGSIFTQKAVVDSIIKGSMMELVSDQIPFNRNAYFLIKDDNYNTIKAAGPKNSLPLNTWTHLVGIRDGNTVYLYINGILAATATGSLGSITPGVSSIGSGVGTFFGVIDEVGVWNRVLSQEEVSQLYNSGLGSTYPFSSIKPSPSPTPTDVNIDKSNVEVTIERPVNNNGMVDSEGFNLFAPYATEWNLIQSPDFRNVLYGFVPNAGVIKDGGTTVPVKLRMVFDNDNFQRLMETEYFGQVQLRYKDKDGVWRFGQKVNYKIKIAGEIPSKRVFVTSNEYNGSLGGVANANTLCQQSANTANLGGKWKAWISDSLGNEPWLKFNYTNGKYQLVNGHLVANNKADLLDSSISNINYTEFGVFKGSGYAWTNTMPNGERTWKNSDPQDCSNWKSSSSQLGGRTGFVNVGDSRWTYIDYQKCNLKASLYCFEQ